MSIADWIAFGVLATIVVGGIIAMAMRQATTETKQTAHELSCGNDKQRRAAWESDMTRKVEEIQREVQKLVTAVEVHNAQHKDATILPMGRRDGA